MLLLGVDGGGTKIEFLLCKEDKVPITQFIIEKCCNLKYTTSGEIIKTLEEGMAKIKTFTALSEIDFAYLGIAECGEESEGVGRADIISLLQGCNFKQYELADDQYSVFRAVSPSHNGVLANAGTGSNINYFHDGVEQNYKSIGYGGRDFGKTLLIEMDYGAIPIASELYQAVKTFLKQDPVAFYNKLNAYELVADDTIPKIAKYLAYEEKHNLKLHKELERHLITIASRWVHKLASYCYINFGLRPETAFDIVLTGSMWSWKVIYTITEKELTRAFPKVNIIYNPGTRPVVGCINIGLEKLRSRL